MSHKSFNLIISICFLICFAIFNGKISAHALDPAFSQSIFAMPELRSGLYVHINCKDGELLEDFVGSRGILGHGLVQAGLLENIRTYLTNQGIYGQAAADAGSFAKLFYADDMVNLLVVEDLKQAMDSGLTITEAMRIVAPQSMALLGQRPGGALTQGELTTLLSNAGITDYTIITENGLWAKVIKERPAGMDEWRNWGYDAEGSRHSNDATITKVPTGVRWLAGPVAPRGYRKAGHTRALVTSGGRLFQMTFNEADNLTNTEADRQMYLRAKDAFNGLFLWKVPWKYQAGLNYMNEIGRQEYVDQGAPLAATPDHVYASCIACGVTKHDAATGTILDSCILGGEPRSIILKSGVLYVTTVDSVYSIDTASLNFNWKVDAGAARNLKASDQGVFFLDFRKNSGDPVKLVKLNLNTGDEEHSVNLGETNDGQTPINFYQDCQIRLWGVSGGYVLVRSSVSASGPKGLFCYSGSDLSLTWQKLYETGDDESSYSDAVLYMNNLIWTRWNPHINGNQWYGLNPATGDSVKGFSYLWTLWSCAMPSALNNWIILPKFLRFQSIEDGTMEFYGGSRGHCRIHSIPANGLLYLLPHNCVCLDANISSEMGVCYTENSRTAQALADAGERLVPGPALNNTPSMGNADANDWPTFRYNMERKSCFAGSVSSSLTEKWSIQIAKPRPSQGILKEEWRVGLQHADLITSPTAAKGLVFVAVPHENKVTALDAATCTIKWNFIAGGRIDAAPTYYKGRSIFGSNDGWVYCLDASNGDLMWKYRAAPAHTRIQAYGQLESPWPVTGAVSVVNDIVAVGSGRSSRSDYGFSVIGLNVNTGEQVWEHISSDLNSQPTVCQPVLVSDGTNFHISLSGGSSYKYNILAGTRSGPAKSPDVLNSHRRGLLCGQWRELLGYVCKGAHKLGFGKVYGDARTPDVTYPSAFTQLLNIRDSDGMVFGYQVYRSERRGWMVPQASYLFGWHKDADNSQWHRELNLPLQIEAQVLAGDQLIVAGANNGVTHEGGGFLWFCSTVDGSTDKSYSLSAPPAHEGLIVADGELFISTTDGKLVCMSTKPAVHTINTGTHADEYVANTTEKAGARKDTDIEALKNNHSGMGNVRTTAGSTAEKPVIISAGIPSTQPDSIFIVAEESDIPDLDASAPLNNNAEKTCSEDHGRLNGKSTIICTHTNTEPEQRLALAEENTEITDSLENTDDSEPIADNDKKNSDKYVIRNSRTSRIIMLLSGIAAFVLFLSI
ncbi:MAG: PQQ-binding-like beta-propeller repeat protein [bacterium]